jgi:hypothetical protein
MRPVRTPGQPDPRPAHRNSTTLSLSADSSTFAGHTRSSSIFQNAGSPASVRSMAASRTRSSVSSSPSASDPPPDSLRFLAPWRQGVGAGRDTGVGGRPGPLFAPRFSSALAKLADGTAMPTMPESLPLAPIVTPISR